MSAACAIAPIGFWSERETRYAALVLRVMQRTPRLARPPHGAMARSRTMRTGMLAPVIGSPSSVPPGVAAEDVRAFADAEDVRAILPYTTQYRFRDGAEVTVPVSVLWGSRDRLLLARQAGRARRLLPQARHVSLPGAGRVAMADAPKAIADELARLHALL